MNNYSWLQKNLHRLALHSNSVREITFILEDNIYDLELIDREENHIFICGLARAGTTVLLNALHESKEFASLTYDDMPFVLAPNLWDAIRIYRKHKDPIIRAHGDDIYVSTDSPEAFEEVFWKTFELEEEIESIYRKFILLILKKYNKNRYLSKNNQNLRRLDKIIKIYPQSTFYVLFRSPLQHAFSLYRQHSKFLEKSKEDKFISEYMRMVGHTEFGLDYSPISSSEIRFQNYLEINHWLEQWLNTYKKIQKHSSEEESIKLICYESLCNDNEVWKKISNISEIDSFEKFTFIESRKKIDQEYDKKLLEDCEKIYEQLLKGSV